MEDYTNKYKGEQVDLALFGGEYQEGVLTAYCSIEDVPHIELNGHILVPLQNVASLHCSSRCDAPEPDWPPRGLESDDEVRQRVLAAVEEIASNHPGEQVLIVSHGGALNALWHNALGVRVERWANCAVYKLAVRDDGFVEID